MTYENEIPDYAMVPAKEIQERVIIPVTKGAIYSPVQVTNITEKPKTVITIEEDILVPDTKPDLREILLINGKARLTSREIDQISKTDDYINVSGEVELQTLYMPENQEMGDPIISVQTRVPFKDQWHTGLAQGSTLTMDCNVEQVDYMVINERKYRVKISLAIMARECADSKVDVFEGISGEEIQMLKEKVEITNIALRKKDTLSISENLEIKDDFPFENILKQDINVVENYKQVTGEKIVINGFVLVNLLYTVADDNNTAGRKMVASEGLENVEESTGSARSSLAGTGSATGVSTGAAGMSERGSATGNSATAGIAAGAAAKNSTESGSRTDCIKQSQERVEFTQFIPIQQGGNWSGSNVCFDGSGLRVKLAQDEELGEVFRLEGEIITYVELYRNIEKEIIVDGYHKEKDFICDFKEEKSRTLVGTTIGESSVREIISPQNPYGDIDKILYTTGEIIGSQSHGEQGKVITEGTVLAKMICQCHESKDGPKHVFSVRQEVPFRVATAVPQMNGDEIINEKMYVKDIWAEKINGKQIEFNAAVLVSAEIMRETPFKVLVNPAFEESSEKAVSAPMVVYVAKKDDNLWNIAKQFKTTVETISQLNQMEDEQLYQGKKLLILR